MRDEEFIYPYEARLLMYQAIKKDFKDFIYMVMGRIEEYASMGLNHVCITYRDYSVSDVSANIDAIARYFEGLGYKAAFNKSIGTFDLWW